MKKSKNAATLVSGILIGAMLTGPAAHAAEQYLKAYHSTQSFYLNGEKVAVEAYNIEGHNYLQLAELGKLLGVSVAYLASDNSVQIGTASQAVKAQGSTVNLPADGSRYMPQIGDVIQCNDGYKYTITDISRWDKNAFASGPMGALPTAACDWSLLEQPKLPTAEARHFTVGEDEYMFVRNLYETRRMLYTLYNAIGENDQTWRNGKPVLSSKGNQLVHIRLTIPDGTTSQVFWPWRATEITNLFNSCPPGSYAMESWDVYKNGVFQRTEYKIHVS